jgi:hypothetical protein
VRYGHAPTAEVARTRREEVVVHYLVYTQDSSASLLPAIAQRRRCSRTALPFSVWCRCSPLSLPSGWRRAPTKLKVAPKVPCASGLSFLRLAPSAAAALSFVPRQQSRVVGRRRRPTPQRSVLLELDGATRRPLYTSFPYRDSAITGFGAAGGVRQGLPAPMAK